MTKDEFILLYEKFLNGQCSLAEKELLHTYQDSMKLLDNHWEGDFLEGQGIHSRVWERLEENLNQSDLKSKASRSFSWLKVAAVVFVTLSTGTILFQYLSKSNVQKPVLVSKQSVDILPGGNKAYLTLNDGSRIVLNNVPSGKLSAGDGMQAIKTKEGLISYHDNKSVDVLPPHAASAVNTITTPAGGQYQVILPDGSIVTLNTASSLRFPLVFNSKVREVELTGEAYFEVAKNKAKPFIVHAKHTSIQVLGTHFNVNAYGEDHMATTTLLEGSVRMKSGESSVLLKPGQQGTVLDNSKSITVKEADIDAAMAWKNGIFLFNDEHLDEVMKKVGRWYSVEVEFRDESVKSETYSGSISRFSRISQVLRKLEVLGGVQFQIEPSKIIVTKK